MEPTRSISTNRWRSCSRATFLVEDLDSTCGTYVDGAKVRSAPLRDGQRIQVGDTVLRVRQTTG